MKTLRKALVGIIFLVPLLLPSKSQAGPFDDWLHSIFSDHHPQPAYHPAQPTWRPYAPNRGGNGYRPYDPFADRNHPAGGGDPSDPGNSVPIDGGLVFLVVAGLGLGVWKVYQVRKGSDVTVTQ